jgi:hypothetical protein
MQSRHLKTDTARVSRLDILISIAVVLIIVINVALEWMRKLRKLSRPTDKA